MAAIEKRTTEAGTTYRVKIRLRGFPPETATFQRKTDANEWAAKTESNMRAGRHFGASKRHTFSELVTAYSEQAKPLLKSWDHREMHLAYWLTAFGDCQLDAITPARIAKERDKLLAEETYRHTKRTGATVVRYLAALSACLSHGVRELQWLEANPVERIKKPTESTGRTRFLSDDERVRLLDACKGHEDLYLAVVLALTTGARQAELMTLHWDQVDFARQSILLRDTKNGERRTIPLVGAARDLLQAREQSRKADEPLVFPATARARKSECIDLRVPWERALKAANIEDFHWHDLRHTAASYLAMNGTSLVELAKLLGHRTLAMVARYSHLSDEHIVSTGQKLADRMNLGGTK
jgi:integrase